MPKDVFEIGRVKLQFTADGKVSWAKFKPAEHISLDAYPDEFESALMRLDTVKTAEEAANQALASYFVLMGLVEAHDPEKGEIKQRIIKCEEYNNGVPHDCEIMFYYESRQI